MSSNSTVLAALSRRGPQDADCYRVVWQLPSGIQATLSVAGGLAEGIERYLDRLEQAEDLDVEGEVRLLAPGGLDITDASLPAELLLDAFAEVQ